MVWHFWCLLKMGIYWEITDTIKKIRETITDASSKVGLEVNSEKTKYMLLSYHQKAGQNHDIKTSNKSFENVT
jgi:hypothetical protein